MIDEREIWACAHQLMRRHGAEAHRVCSERADALGAEGQPEGQRTFRRILSCIEALKQTSPASAVH